MLPENLKLAAEEKAFRTKRSLGQLIRDALERDLASTLSRDAQDPFLADARVFRGKSPRDLARNHDDYLYGGKA